MARLKWRLSTKLQMADCGKVSGSSLRHGHCLTKLGSSPRFYALESRCQHQKVGLGSKVTRLCPSRRWLFVGNNVFYFQFQILKAKDDVLFKLSPVLLAWVSSSQILSRTCLGRMLQFWALLQALLLVKQRLEMLNRITSLTNCLSSIDKNTSDMTLKNKGNIYLHLYNSWTTLCQKVNWRDAK